ncbi:MAG: DDE-type integrase/transposase/recombinase [Bacteroidales bacterium]|nr:DDE-type integrase/transposase/recombinase [Bacteroidales bacterium]
MKLSKDCIENSIIDVILNERKTYKRLGGRRMFFKLNVKTVGINKFEKIMSANNLGVKIRKRRIKTTQGVHEETDRNLINGLELNDINQVIAGDITYLILANKTFYIYTLKDMYSKRIIGLHASNNLFAISALIALIQGCKLRRKSIYNCIHHTDAGSQYKSKIYRKKIKDNKLRQSIAENCLENGMAEQLNGMIKNDYLPDKIKSVEELNRVLVKIKNALNNEIPIKALGYKTPVQFEDKIKNIPKDQRLVIKLHDFSVNYVNKKRGTFNEE